MPRPIMVAGGEHCQLRAAIEVLVPYTSVSSCGRSESYGGTKVLAQVARTVAILQRLERGAYSSEKKGASDAETSAQPGK